MYVFSNNGLSCRMVAKDHNPSIGEILFPSYPSVEQLRAVFPNYDKELAAANAITKITPIEFQERFTTEEWNGILTAAMTDPVILGWVFKISASAQVDLTDPALAESLKYLSGKNLLTNKRVNTLLATS